MIKFYGPVQDDAGNKLVGYSVRIIDSSGAQVNITADKSGTNFQPTANLAPVDDNGMVQFWYTPEKGQDYQILNPEGLIETTIEDFSSSEAEAASGLRAFDSLADIKAAPASTLSYSLVGTSIDGIFNYETTNAPYTADDVNVIKLDSTDLSVGALVRQQSSSVSAVQSGAGAIVESVQDVLQRTVWVESYLVNGGVGDQTAAFQAAIDALPARGGIVRFRGDYTIGAVAPIDFPAEPKTVRLTGEGKLLQGAANAPMIQKITGISRCYQSRMDGFTVVAHVDSVKTNPANIAINIHGFDSCEIDVRMEGNATFTATAGRFYAVVSGHSNLPFCYNNEIRLLMSETAGPAKGVWLHDDGAGTLANANLNKVSVWAYALDGCDIAVDVQKTTQTIVHDGLFEDCVGMRGVYAGNFTTTRDNWFELIDEAINYGSSATLANNCISERDQFSGSNTIVIHSSVAAWPEFRNPLFGSMTFENESATASANYTVIKAHAQPSTPTIGWILNAPTTLTSNGNTVRHPVDHHGQTTIHLSYNVTPAATGRSIMQITCPSGFKLVSTNVGIEDLTGGATVNGALSTDADGRNHAIYWTSTNEQFLNIEMTIKAIL